MLGRVGPGLGAYPLALKLWLGVEEADDPCVWSGDQMPQMQETKGPTADPEAPKRGISAESVLSQGWSWAVPARESISWRSATHVGELGAVWSSDSGEGAPNQSLLQPKGFFSMGLCKGNFTMKTTPS